MALHGGALHGIRLHGMGVRCVAMHGNACQCMASAGTCVAPVALHGIVRQRAAVCIIACIRADTARMIARAQPIVGYCMTERVARVERRLSGRAGGHPRRGNGSNAVGWLAYA